jgi:hypothetical protein
MEFLLAITKTLMQFLDHLGSGFDTIIGKFPDVEIPPHPTDHPVPGGCISVHFY